MTYPPQPGWGPPPLNPAEDRQWATLAHALGIVSILAPLIIWAVFRPRGRFTEDQAKEALNFQITVAIAGFATTLLSFIGIGLLLIPVVLVADVLFSILGALAANRGQWYRYPVTLRPVR
ncbi:MAG: DUF4870 domain-containing protein [Bifidobacteriaceae bacterium]|jgi:uncharacterized Tic20 family protein|nr:DUF4870 domain-containing protein [Bifidobacteriaceae bacterium]